MTSLTSIDFLQVVYKNPQVASVLAISSFALYFASTVLVIVTRRKEYDGPRFLIFPVGVGAFTNYLAYVFGRDGIKASRRFGILSIILLRVALILLIVSLFTMFSIGVTQSNLAPVVTPDAVRAQE